MNELGDLRKELIDAENEVERLKKAIARLTKQTAIECSNQGCGETFNIDQVDYHEVYNSIPGEFIDVSAYLVCPKCKQKINISKDSNLCKLKEQFKSIQKEYNSWAI